MSDGGKGCKPRPFANRAQYESNWDAIFKGNKVTTFTTEDREEAQKQPVVIVDSGASVFEPIPFAGMVELQEENKRLKAENEELRNTGKFSSNH